MTKRHGQRCGHGDPHQTQARQTWMILAGCAALGPDVSGKGPGRATCGDLAERTGRDRSEAITPAPPLGIPGAWCAERGLPAINALVNQETGEPGDEAVLREGRSVAQEQAAARRQRWRALHPPREAELLEMAEA